MSSQGRRRPTSAPTTGTSSATAATSSRGSPGTGPRASPTARAKEATWPSSSRPRSRCGRRRLIGAQIRKPPLTNLIFLFPSDFSVESSPQRPLEHLLVRHHRRAHRGQVEVGGREAAGRRVRKTKYIYIYIIWSYSVVMPSCFLTWSLPYQLWLPVILTKNIILYQKHHACSYFEM